MNQLQRDIIIAERIKEIEGLYKNLISNVGVIQRLSEDNKRQLSRVLNLPKGDKGDRGEQGPRGVPGRDGKDGKDGTDGKTPVKGVDYLTPKEREELYVTTLARIKAPKDGKDAIVDEEKLAETIIKYIKDKGLVGIDSIKGLRTEMDSYRHQMAMKQAGQHGGGDTVVAGSGISITSNANGTKTITATASGGSVTDFIFTDANGITGVVTTSTTTPTLTLDISGLDASKIADGSVSNTEFQYLNGVTSAIQTQINAKMTNPMTTGGDIIYGGASGTPTRLANGTAGQILTSNGTTLAPTWEDAAGGGNVSNTGTPLNNQIAVWTDATTIEGDIDLTFDTATNTLGVGLIGLDGRVQVHAVKSDASDGLLIEASDGTDIGVLGVANTANVTWYGSHNFSGATQDTIAAFTGAGKTLGSLATATYPSLTELSYVKGVTSAIQTQLNAKQATITFGTGVQTALGVNVGTAGAFVVNGGALGTPSSGTVTNLTGTASININGTVGATTPTTATFTTATINTGIVPDANDGAYLGQAGTAFSDLFLAEGAVINWDSGDATITQTGNVLAVAGADFRVATADVGTNADSVPTLSSTSTFTNKTLTSPTINTATLGGANVLAEGASIQLDPALSADGTYSGITITGTAGATLAFGDLIYLAVADSRWELVDADSVTTCGAVLTGMCVLAAAGDGSATTILLQGNIRADAAFPALTVGANVYAGLTAGDIVTTAPSATDDVVHVVGKALTADSIYFNPSMDYITVV